MDNVKIIYCKNEDGGYVYYNDVEKTKKYFCIDCGDELIVKDGDIKIKHLSHKSNSECQSTGESMFHNYWKTNLFKQGFYITVNDEEYEITKIHNEVSLKKFYNKDWDRDIIVDVLLETTGGNIVIEIKYTNAKSWTETAYFYNQLDLLEVFEIKVFKNITKTPIWNTRNELLAKELKALLEKPKKIPMETDSCSNMSDYELVQKAIKADPHSKLYQSFCSQIMQGKTLSEKQRDCIKL